MPIDVGTQDFEAKVVARSHEVPVVVDFWAAWCGPCRVLGPQLEAMEAQAEGAWELVKIDVDAHPGLQARFGVQGIPAVKAFRDGQVVAEFVGAQPKTFLDSWFAQLDPTAVARRAAAEAAARDAFRAGLAAEAGGIAVDVLRGVVDAAPRDLDARWRLAHALAGAGDDEGALGQLLKLVRLDRKYRDDGARKVMLRLFEAIGAQHPTTRAWRDRLARTLY